MRIIWSNDDYYIDRVFGSSLCGISYNGKRPDLVVVQYGEFIESIETLPLTYYLFYDYIVREFRDNNITLEIRGEDSK